MALLWTDARAAGAVVAAPFSTTIGGVGVGGAGGVGLGGVGLGGVGLGGTGGEGGVAIGGTGLGGNAAGGNAAGGNNSLHFDQPRQSPAVFMNAPMPTAPCQATVGGFLSFIGGAGFAYSRTLDNCEIREEARIAHGIGQAEMAREILCLGRYASQTSQCKTP